MNALKLMKEEHYQISKTMEQLLKTEENALTERKKLFKKLQQQFTYLYIMEEEVFHPFLENYKNPWDMDDEYDCDELHLAKDIINKLNKIPCHKPVWLAGVHVLKENLEDYLKREEDKIFRKARELMDTSVLNELGQKIYQIKLQVH